MFAQNYAAISDAYNASDVDWLVYHMPKRVDGLATRLNWEIGPYNHPDRTFVLSPTIRENLALTRSALGLSPKIDGWHFLHAKPRKDLTRLVFEAQGCIVNADDCQYQLHSNNKGEFVDLLLYINAAGFPSVHEQLFSEIVVEALVGEEMRLDRIGFVQPNILEDNTSNEKTTPIRYLHDHLITILSSVEKLEQMKE